MHTGACQHGDRGDGVVHGCGAACVHGVCEARIAHLQIAPVVARGGHGQVLQFDDTMHRTLSCLRAFERHRPRPTAGLAAHGAQLPIKRHQRLLHAVLQQQGGHAVHRVALGNAAQIELQDLAVATSGDYRHYMEVGDARLAHTMDARRAAPVNNAVASVTVLAHTCMEADAWATALLVAGPGEGLAMAQRMGLDALFMLRRAEGLVEMGLGRFGNSTGR